MIKDITIEELCDEYKMSKEEMIKKFANKDGKWTEERPTKGVRILKQTDLYLAESEIIKLVEFKNSEEKETSLEWACGGDTPIPTRFEKMEDGEGILIERATAVGAETRIEISNRVIDILDEML